MNSKRKGALERFNEMWENISKHFPVELRELIKLESVKLLQSGRCSKYYGKGIVVRKIYEAQKIICDENGIKSKNMQEMAGITGVSPSTISYRGEKTFIGRVKQLRKSRRLET